jgi:hypothetical protein
VGVVLGKLPIPLRCFVVAAQSRCFASGNGDALLVLLMALARCLMLFVVVGPDADFDFGLVEVTADCRRS